MKKIDKKKVWTAFIIIPPIVLLIGFGPPLLLNLLVLLASLLGLREFYNLCLPQSRHSERFVGIGLGLVLSIVVSNGGDLNIILPFFVILILAISVLFMVTSKNLSQSPAHVGITLFGIFYIGFLLSHVTSLRKFQNGSIWVLFLISTVWAGDICALLCGTFLGRHKLYPKISPNKTYEGLIGALLGSIFISLAFRMFFIQHLDIKPCVLLAIGMGLLGQLGDFTESMLKRSAEVKDSSSLIPGHGGMLDRLDSFLFSAPFLYYSLTLFLKETR